MLFQNPVTVVMTPETVFLLGATILRYFRMTACNENHALKIKIIPLISTYVCLYPSAFLSRFSIQIKNYKGNLILKPTEKNGLTHSSEVLVFHIRSLSKNRLMKKLGTITPDELNKIKQGLNDILKY